jgi:hypothetical protein
MARADCVFTLSVFPRTTLSQVPPKKAAACQLYVEETTGASIHVTNSDSRQTAIEFENSS